MEAHPHCWLPHLRPHHQCRDDRCGGSDSYHPLLYHHHHHHHPSPSAQSPSFRSSSSPSSPSSLKSGSSSAVALSLLLLLLLVCTSLPVTVYADSDRFPGGCGGGGGDLSHPPSKTQLPLKTATSAPQLLFWNLLLCSVLSCACLPNLTFDPK
ncbi:hypothetical protein TYRP_013779 [Tyrophagus putrescentiae]|nr:hypothetical protein TYRP_013779 [Tyrophagus putrescentiae]